VWEPVLVDLSAYAGQSIILRFSFRSDTSVVYPGAFIDNIQVAEAADIPIVISTASLPDGYENGAYSAQINGSSATGNATWSIVPGGTNDGWLSIDANGLLTGTPGAANVGAVTVTVRSEEPTNPTNFDEATYNFNVGATVFVDSIDACPGTWTLSGEWQCGAPTSGPLAAFSGTNVLATILTGNYSNNQAWATNTASSAPISLAGTTAPVLRFRVWYRTEGSLDGFNVKISTNGGTTYALATAVTPAFTGTIGGEMGWGGSTGHQFWDEYVVDLAAFAGMSVNVRFAMRTDGSVTYPGVYIDDVVITD
jgi:hypothetical protein